VEHEERVQDSGSAGRAGWRDNPSSTLISQNNTAQAAALWLTLGRPFAANCRRWWQAIIRRTTASVLRGNLQPNPRGGATVGSYTPMGARQGRKCHARGQLHPSTGRT